MDLNGRQEIDNAIFNAGYSSANFTVKPEKEDIPREGVEFIGVLFRRLNPGYRDMDELGILNALGEAGLIASNALNNGKPSLRYMDTVHDPSRPEVATVIFQDLNHR